MDADVFACDYCNNLQGYAMVPIHERESARKKGTAGEGTRSTGEETKYRQLQAKGGSQKGEILDFAACDHTISHG